MGAATVSVSLALNPLLLSHANAAVPGCFYYNNGTDYGQFSPMEVYGNGSDAILQATLEGIRADVNVGVAADVDCQWVQSVFVLNPTQQKVMEYGWARGKFACFNDEAFVDWAAPHPFAVAVDPVLTNGRACRKWGTTYLSGTAHEFRVSDKNQDYRWGGWLDNVEQQPGSEGWALSFLYGPGGVNTERAAPGDPGNANFNNIQELHSDVWSLTDHLGSIPAAQYDTDPDYHLVRDSGSHVRMVHD